MSAGQLVSSRYQMISEIGRGGHSIVWRGRDTRTGEPVAIKMLHEAAASNPELAVRLVREHRVMVTLVGTCAVRAVGLGTAPDGAMCLVMELLEGADLDVLLERTESEGRRLGVIRMLSILDPVVETVSLAHDRGIVHRDLKPGNVYVLERGGVRLLDFGLAKVRSERPLTKDGMIIGSPSYIAPEAWSGRASEVDHRADLYSLAAIVFRVLAGRVPFEAETIPAKLELATRAPRPSLHALRPDLPPAIDDWIRQALAVDPDERFGRADGMWGALYGALGLPRRAARTVPGA